MDWSATHTSARKIHTQNASNHPNCTPLQVWCNQQLSWTWTRCWGARGERDIRHGHYSGSIIAHRMGFCMHLKPWCMARVAPHMEVMHLSMETTSPKCSSKDVYTRSPADCVTAKKWRSFLVLLAIHWQWQQWYTVSPLGFITITKQTIPCGRKRIEFDLNIWKRLVKNERQ